MQDYFHETYPNREILFFTVLFTRRNSENCLKNEPCDKHSHETCEFHTSKKLEPQTVQDLDAEHTDVLYHSTIQ
jgi:hypothetical protein